MYAFNINSPWNSLNLNKLKLHLVKIYNLYQAYFSQFHSIKENRRGNKATTCKIADSQVGMASGKVAIIRN